MVREMNDRISLMEHRHGYVSSAFPQNDLGKPDYDGHRRAHLQLIEDGKVVAGYKGEVAKTVLGVIAGGVITLLISGFMSAITK
jgi:hypothetical protein